MLVFRCDSSEITLIEANPERCALKGALHPVIQQGTNQRHPVVGGGRLYLRDQDILMRSVNRDDASRCQDRSAIS